MAEQFVIGVNLSHDSSCSIHTRDGKLLGAAEEERFTRVKNQSSFPTNAIRNLLSDLNIDGAKDISNLIIGSHENPNQVDIQVWHQIFNPQSHPGWPNQPHIVAPGSHSEIAKHKKNFRNSKEYVDFEVNSKLDAIGVRFNQNLHWIAHHDAHSASGYFGAPWRTTSSETLAVSLDGSGDYESGVVQLFDKSGFVKDLARIPFTQSLGLVYSEVTSRYGFKRHRHEGKITGLAALGEFSDAVSYLLDCIKIIDGTPVIDLSKNKFNWIMNRIQVKLKFSNHKKPESIERMVEVATSLSPKYADLAYAIQAVIEERIVELIIHWMDISKVKNITLAGGVFSNVKLNQKLAELKEVHNVFIFPNMGDGGLSAGGVWRYLSDEKLLGDGPMFDSMYLGASPAMDTNLNTGEILFENFAHIDSLTLKIANLLNLGFIGASVIGRMEFGPRALCNRSIFASPFNSSINADLNHRLNRTEFMPFAPVVLYEFASDIFDFSKHVSLTPFEYMTMTVDVKYEWRPRIPAVVHVDGTARPQLIKEERNPIAYNVLKKFKLLTGIPVLVNTSFNAHEEPIIENLDQGLDSLRKNRVDFVFNENNIYYLKTSQIAKLFHPYSLGQSN